MSNVALLSNGAVNNYVDKKRWVWVSRKYVRCPFLSTQGGWGVKIGYNLTYVVVECPLSSME
jgi:hypothetical protein